MKEQWNTMVKDYTRYNMSVEKPPEDFKYYNIVEGARIFQTDSGLINAIQSGNEIMIHCHEVIYVSNDFFYQYVAHHLF
jgi:hypothetical protein